MNEEQSKPLREKEMNWFANAYRILQNKRNCIVELEDSAQYEDNYEKEHTSLMEDEIRDELIAICVDVIDLIDSNLFQNVEISTCEKAFAYKIKGDFLR